MTKDQFAYWLVGYITVHKIDSAEINAEEAQAIGVDVLDAARSVGAKTVRLTAGPMLPVSPPQPGDLDYVADTGSEHGK